VLLGEPLDAPPQVRRVNAQALNNLLLLGEFGLGPDQLLLHLLGFDRASLERAGGFLEQVARVLRDVELVDGAHQLNPHDLAISDALARRDGFLHIAKGARRRALHGDPATWADARRAMARLFRST